MGNPFDTQQKAHSVRSEEGQSLVELVLVFPLLLILVVALVNFAFIFQTYISVTNAANVGAMYGATSLSAAQNTTAIRNQVLAESDTWHCPSPSVSSSTSADTYGYQRVNVTVICAVSDLIAVPSVMNNVTISYTAVLRVKP